MHFSYLSSATAFLMAFGTAIHAQGVTTSIQVGVQGGQPNMTPKEMGLAADSFAFKHQNSGKTIAATLRASGQYSTFLGLAERAGLLPLLNGTVYDTMYTAVTFTEQSGFKMDAQRIAQRDSGWNAVSAQYASQLPPGVSINDLRDGAFAAMDSVYDEGKKYALAQDSLLTVFAPTNAAFAKLPKSTLDSLTRDSAVLVKFVRAHFVNKGVYMQGLPEIRSLQSLAGGVLPVAGTGGQITVGGERVEPTELVATNGVVHGLQAVLPWTETPTAPSTP